MIGKTYLRKEDERLLRGSGKFVDDFVAAGTLYMAVVRSPHPAARIVSTQAQGALDRGAHSVWFHADLPELTRPLPLFREPATNPYCDLMRPPPQFALADGVVRHVGEPVAIVLADTPALAVDAAEAVEIEYEPHDAIVDPFASLAGKGAVHEGHPNLVAHLQANVGDIDAAIKQADVVLEERLVYPRLASMPIEPRGVSAEYDGARDTLVVRAGHQLPYALRSAAANFTGVREENVTVLCGDTGGAFGPKSTIYPEDVLVPLLATKTGRAVKWIQTRSEFMLSSQHARDQITDVRIAARADGTLLGLDVKILKDAGAYLCWAVIEPTNTINHIPSQYRLPAYRAEAHTVLTNKVPSAPYRGTGRPEATWAIERSIDLVAQALGLDPLDVRRKNLIPAAAMPYQPGNVYRDGVAVTYDTGDFPRVFERTLEAAEIAQWKQQQGSTPPHSSRRIGIGAANYVEASGIGWPCEGATVKIDEAGRIEVMIGVSQSGQGHETIFAQICAEYLGVRFEDIRVRGGDTSLLPYGFGTGGSRVTLNTGNAVAQAATEVQRKAKLVAATLMECSPEDLEMRDGRIQVVGVPGKSLPLATVAATAAYSRALADEGGPGLWATKYFYPPTVTWSSGTHVAVVEVDTDTGAWKLLKYAIGHDCGRQVNPVLVEGQVLGSFAQGLGIAIGERIVYSDDGQLLTGTLMDYPMPRADEIPDIVLEHFEFPSTSNPLGVRGVGEGNVGPVAAAIAGAITDALDGRIRIRVPVMTPAAILDLIHAGAQQR